MEKLLHILATPRLGLHVQLKLLPYFANINLGNYRYIIWTVGITYKWSCNYLLYVRCKMFLFSLKLQCPNDDNSMLLLSEAITVVEGESRGERIVKRGL